MHRPLSRGGLLVPCFLILLVLAGTAPASTSEEIRARILTLREAIQYHDERYHRDSQPEISDQAYDRLRDELDQLEEKWPDEAAEVPFSLPAIPDDRTARFPAGRHAVPMLSLNKATDREAMAAFYRRLQEATGEVAPECALEPKVDGLAISLVYERGRFVRALTRGNGLEGEEVTANLLVIGGFPLELSGSSVPEFLEIRGEVAMEIPTFERLNEHRAEEGLAPYATPRNLAAGSIRLTDPIILKGRTLRLVCFAWGAWSPPSTEPLSHRAFIQTMEDWGFPVLPKIRYLRGLEAIEREIEAELGRSEHDNLPTDGLVIKLNSVPGRALLGATETAPNWALACKPAPGTAVTRLRSVSFQLGRSGRLTPVAELDPVRMGGREVTRASLHNWTYLRDLNLGPGDRVLVALSGDVIPQIIKGLPEASANRGGFAWPKQCPACGQPIEVSGEDASGYCRFAGCPGVLKERVRHFLETMGVKGMASDVLETLISEGDMTDLGRFLEQASTPDWLEPFMGSEAMGFRRALQQIRERPRWRLLQAMSLPAVGPVAARRLESLFADRPWPIEWAPTVEELRSSGLSEGAARFLARYLADPPRREEWRRVMRFLNS